MKLGTPATGEDFRGRQQELNDLWRYLGNNHIKLPGARRLGKTSILMRLVDQAPEHGVLAQWVDVSSMQTTADFLDQLDREFPAQGISVFMAKQAAKVADWLGRIKSIGVQAPEILGGGGASIDLSNPAASSWLPRAHALQQRLHNQPLLVLLDEFPVMLQGLLKQNPAEAEQLLKVLRIWRQTGHWRFVFTGSIGLQSLLERHGLAVHMNDCFDFPLGPMRTIEAIQMWQHFSQRRNWHCPEEISQHALARVGWASPYYLNLLLDEALRMADIRAEETPTDQSALCQADVDNAYDNLLAQRSRFQHWEHRLRSQLSEPDLGFSLAVLTHVAKKDDGLTLAQLNQRLTKREPNPDERARLLPELLTRLSDEGYLSPPDAKGRVRFLSFPLRDWWRSNHA